MNETAEVQPVDLEAGRELCAKATPGPWAWDGDPGNDSAVYRADNAPWLVYANSGGSPVIGGDLFVHKSEDALFLAQARTLLPAALDEIEMLRLQLEVMELRARSAEGIAKMLREKVEHLTKAFRLNAGYRGSSNG